MISFSAVVLASLLPAAPLDVGHAPAGAPAGIVVAQVIDKKTTGGGGGGIGGTGSGKPGGDRSAAPEVFTG